MLRSDDILALDEVTEACQRAADYFEKFAEKVDESQLSALFRDLAESHRRHVEQLDRQVEAMGELPSRPNAERETLEWVATWMRSVFSASQREALLEKAAETEDRLAQSIEQGLEVDMPQEARQLLKDIRETVGAALERISSARKDRSA